MSFQRVLLAAVLLALCFVPAAQARVIKLNWVDKTSTDYGYQPMTFKVKDVVITPKAWAVHASVVNRSKKTLRVLAADHRTYPQLYTFSLGWASPCPPPSISCGLDTRDYTYAKPRLPRSLKPGQTWTGVFGGPGGPVRGKLVNVVFGYFQPPGPNRGFNWVTQNAFKL